MSLRRAAGRLRQRAADIAATRRTIHRPVVTQPGPPTSTYAAFGEGSWLVPPVRVQGAPGIEVGAGVVILEHLEASVAPGARVTVGDGARLGRFVTITCALSIDIGAAVSSSDGAAITDCWGPISGSARSVPPPPPSPVVIEEGAYLGAGCVIGPGVRVGAGAFVGEGAVVLDDVPSRTVVYGNPAIVVRRFDPDHGWQGARFG